MVNNLPQRHNCLRRKSLPLKGVFFLVLFLFISIELFAGKIAHQNYHIAIIHSYDQEFPAYNDFNKILKKELKKAGVKADINNFYLDSQRNLNNEGSDKCYNYLDSVSVWKPDLIIANGDEVVFSCLSSGHPLTKQIPILFTGVNFPRWKQLQEFPNVTGIWDKPNYSQTVKMIEKLFGSTRIRFFYDNSYLANEAIKEVAMQLKDRAPETSEILKEYVHSQDSVIWKCSLGKETSELEERKGVPESTQFFFTNLCKERGRDVLWAISGFVTHSVFVITKYDYRTMNVGRMASTPVFSVINEGFGYNRGILGGYMTTLNTQIKQTAAYTAHILLDNDNPLSLPIIETEKEFVVDYDELLRWKIPIESIPENYEIINMPFHIEHRTAFIALTIFGILLAGFFIIYPLYLYYREHKRKRNTQRELIREKELLSLSLEKSNIYAWKYNDETDTFICDKEFFEHLNIPFRTYTLEEISADIHPEERFKVLKIFNLIKNKIENPTTTQCRCNFNGMGYIWYDLRYIIPSETIKGAETIIGFITNIQDFKNKEEELTKAKDLAAKAELKQSFLANMSHEIRTPLNAIVGFSNILANEEDLPTDDKSEFVSSINNNCELLLKLVNDILEISRIESGHMTFNYSICNVNSLIDHMYTTHSVLMPTNITFLKEIPEKAYHINTDINRLSQVITNLLNNASKFTESGYIKLGYNVNSSEKEISIYVEDTGKGIAEEEQKMIFERFYKQDEFAQGTGLGLSISSVIIEKLRGRINVSSEVGKGSRFTLTLSYLNENSMIQKDSLAIQQ